MGQLNYITPRGLKTLQEEAQFLRYQERPKIVETVAWAASNGDRSENADYIYGKRRLREIDSRLRFLTRRIEAAQPVDPAQQNSEVIVFGATVQLEYESGNIKTVFIVGEDEIDIPKGKISWKSPLAKALLGKKAGDEVLLKKPKSEEYIVILEVQYKNIP
ncbi:MAG: transcription elongation factor GreB [Bdellovibrionales bacterium]